MPASTKTPAPPLAATRSVQAPAATGGAPTPRAVAHIHRAWYPVGNLAPWTALLAERFPVAPVSRPTVVTAVITIPTPAAPKHRTAVHSAAHPPAPTPSAAALIRRPRPDTVSFARLKSRTNALLRKWKRRQVGRAPLRALLADIRRAAAQARPKARAQLAGLTNRLAAALKSATKPATPSARKPKTHKPAAHKPAAHKTAHPAKAAVKAHPKHKTPKAKPSTTKRPASAGH